MAREQIHRATMRVTCDLEIPQYQKDKGVEIDLLANDELAGQLFISGAHVYFRKNRKSKWRAWSFTEFARLLEENK